MRLIRSYLRWVRKSWKDTPKIVLVLLAVGLLISMAWDSYLVADDEPVVEPDWRSSAGIVQSASIGDADETRILDDVSARPHAAWSSETRVDSGGVTIVGAGGGTVVTLETANQSSTLVGRSMADGSALWHWPNNVVGSISQCSGVTDRGVVSCATTDENRGLLWLINVRTGKALNEGVPLGAGSGFGVCSDWSLIFTVSPTTGDVSAHSDESGGRLWTSHTGLAVSEDGEASCAAGRSAMLVTSNPVGSPSDNHVAELRRSSGQIRWQASRVHAVFTPAGDVAVEPVQGTGEVAPSTLAKPGEDPYFSTEDEQSLHTDYAADERGLRIQGLVRPSGGRGLAAYDRADGTMLWEQPEATGRVIATCDYQVIVAQPTPTATRASAILALDSVKGKVTWSVPRRQQPDPLVETAAGACTTNGEVVAITDNGLRAFSLADGSPAWTINNANDTEGTGQRWVINSGSLFLITDGALSLWQSNST